MNCKICNRQFVTYRALGIHLNKSHKDCCGQTYYDKYLKKPDEGVCPVCGEKCKFISFNEGYHKYCSVKCQSNATKEKAKLTKFKHFGKGKYFSDGAINRIADANHKNASERYKHYTQTCLEKYGVKNYSQTDECRKKVKRSLLERYGDENYHNVELTKKRCLEKYGVENFMQRQDIDIFTKYRERTGYSSPFANPAVIKKREENNLEKYGVKFVSQLHEIRVKSAQKYTYNDLGFDSKWELAYFIYLTDNNIEFEYQPNIKMPYMFENKERFYMPDFKVNGEIQEVKGPHFFKDGKMINPFDETMNALFEAKHQCMLNNNVKIITDCSKYLDYVNEKYTKDFLNLFRNNLDFPYPKNDIVKLYHHSIYDARVGKHLSPKEAWQDKKLILKSALNRLKYKGKCSPSDILQGFNVAKIAPKVSVFKPELAKRLVNTYLNDYETIFDPFSGFSGRMLGACACDKKYVGQDKNAIHVEESNRMIQDLKLNAVVSCKDIFESSGTYDCLFTCSPYKLKETWNENENDLSCDEWIDECLKRFKCKRYLFVVDDTVKYKDKIIETLENKSHFGSNYEYVVMI